MTEVSNPQEKGYPSFYSSFVVPTRDGYLWMRVREENDLEPISYVNSQSKFLHPTYHYWVWTCVCRKVGGRADKVKSTPSRSRESNTRPTLWCHYGPFQSFKGRSYSPSGPIPHTERVPEFPFSAPVQKRKENRTEGENKGYWVGKSSSFPVSRPSPFTHLNGKYNCKSYGGCDLEDWCGLEGWDYEKEVIYTEGLSLLPPMSKEKVEREERQRETKV